MTNLAQFFIGEGPKGRVNLDTESEAPDGRRSAQFPVDSHDDFGTSRIRNDDWFSSDQLICQHQGGYVKVKSGKEKRSHIGISMYETSNGTVTNIDLSPRSIPLDAFKGS
jgi:hypothetical protein